MRQCCTQYEQESFEFLLSKEKKDDMVGYNIHGTFHHDAMTEKVLNTGQDTIVQWIPKHCGVAGHNVADENDGNSL